MDHFPVRKLSQITRRYIIKFHYIPLNPIKPPLNPIKPPWNQRVSTIKPTPFAPTHATGAIRAPWRSLRVLPRSSARCVGKCPADARRHPRPAWGREQWGGWGEKKLGTVVGNLLVIRCYKWLLLWDYTFYDFGVVTKVLITGISGHNSRELGTY